MPFDRCRATKQAQKTKKSASLNGSKRATITTKSSAHLTPNSSGDVRREGTPAPTSAVKQTSASGSSPPLAALPPKALSAETGRPPLLNLPLGETLSTARKVLSVEGASPTAISNCADEPFVIATPAVNEIDVSTERSNRSIAGGSLNTTKSGDATPSPASGEADISAGGTAYRSSAALGGKQAHVRADK